MDSEQLTPFYHDFHDPMLGATQFKLNIPLPSISNITALNIHRAPFFPNPSKLIDTFEMFDPSVTLSYGFAICVQ